MAEAARALPRHWDGHRLLRFLTGLALLALAFAAPAFAAGGFAVPAADTPPAAVRTVTDVSADSARADTAGLARPADADKPAGAVQAAPHVAVPLSAKASRTDRPVTLLAGAALAAHGSRGPPLR